jgi:hypothetical protein
MCTSKCVNCGAGVYDAWDTCPKCGKDPRVEQPSLAAECSHCGGSLVSLGVDRLRFGGTRGAWKLVFGEWAELGEGVLPVEILACQACRRMEFRLAADAELPAPGS